MNPESHILYIDLELDAKDRITDLGAILGNRELHEKSTQRLEGWIQEAQYICGHNVVAHDLPHLKKQLQGDPLAGKPVIDTLLWSPLLSPESPYHKLVKGYHLVNEDAPNDPLADSKLCRTLLQDQVTDFEALDPSLSTIYHALLGGREGYSGLFQLTAFVPLNGMSTADRIRLVFKDRICTTADLEPMVRYQPVELAYALALITTKSTSSIVPEYVVRQFPGTRAVLEQLRFDPCTVPSCGYCAQSLDPKKALKERFGHADFRLFKNESVPGVQERAVRCAGRGGSLLAVFPTGGGKSITFQLPALMRGELTRDLTVVISPLVSLMKDQVDVLKSRHGVVESAFLSGLLSPLEREEAIERVRDGEVHLLYISPESLRSPTIFRLLHGRNIARFIIDEAHCFSSWGQDFRVDYLYIADFIKDLQRAKGLSSLMPISCFTATAKPQVVEDIRSYFKERLKVDLELFVTRAPRENLSYEVVPVVDPKDKVAKLVGILKENEGSAIVYVSRVKRVSELVEVLTKSGFKAVGFHGQMEREQKQENQKAFMTDAMDVMVATSAFGMGVDKEDVKTIIHFNISDSLENYIQEAGRAGRRSDIEAKCFVLYHESDLSNHFRLLQSSKLNQKQIDQVWGAIKSMTRVRQSVNKSALEIAKAAGWDVEMRDLETKVKSAIAALEDQGYLDRKLNYTSVKATSLLVRKVDDAIRRINSAPDLDEQQKKACARVIQRIVKDKECRIDYLADVLEMNIRQAQETVDLLRSAGVLADGKDLTAFINTVRSKNASRSLATAVMQVELGLLEFLDEKPINISLKELNQRLRDKGVSRSTVEHIQSTLLYWQMRGVLSKKRLKRQEELYRLALRKPRAELQALARGRHKLAAECLVQIEGLVSDGPKNLKETPVTFSLVELKRSLAQGMLAEAHDLKAIESALLYMNHMKVLQLQGGFMVYFQRLHIERKEHSSGQRYKKEDFAKLQRYYANKVQQIHFVGEYARKRIANYKDSLVFVDDYFKMSYEAFVSKYFPNRRTEITRAMTEARFKELFGDLTTAQLAIVNDNAGNILISAGPGSGKTKVVVHKVASLLLMEGVKSEQFLMLTFSKSASLEFRSRIYKLVPEYRGLLKIATFHGFCFDLLGEVGDLERAEGVIKRAMEALEDKDIELPSVLNKSVLVLDEFQDLSAEEWELVCALKDKVAGLRVVAVGDDDQNIFDFRNKGISYWNEFHTLFSPKSYSLLTNFRSAPSIVTFNNRIIEPVVDRSKKDEVIEAHSKVDGSIAIHEHVSEHMAEPLVNDLIKGVVKGTTAVLAHSNEDVLVLSAALTKAGVNVRTVHGSGGFLLDKLHEVRQFTDLLDMARTHAGTISKENWQRTKDHFLKMMDQSPLQEDMQDIIALFEERTIERFEMQEWRSFTRELRLEEAVKPSNDAVLVTTIHKAKGKEFDSVFLMLKNASFRKDADRRLLYVACSRAKRHLSIHVNTPLLRYASDMVDYGKDLNEYLPPEFLEYVLGWTQVQLGDHILAQENIKRISSGTPLHVGSTFSIQPDGHQMKFSADMKKDVLDKFKARGYIPSAGSVEYKVHWCNPNDGVVYQVILPRITLSKKL
ncbi:MAG: RecQ family ATP-dependent DNA helicase [Flavobacteriales bacterium]|nr:RecQ family ATP-dependent DNA helicase [Flavobacteriales bacterium]